MGESRRRTADRRPAANADTSREPDKKAAGDSGEGQQVDAEQPQTSAAADSGQQQDSGGQDGGQQVDGSGTAAHVEHSEMLPPGRSEPIIGGTDAEDMAAKAAPPESASVRAPGSPVFLGSGRVAVVGNAAGEPLDLDAVLALPGRATVTLDRRIYAVDSVPGAPNQYLYKLLYRQGRTIPRSELEKLRDLVAAGTRAYEQRNADSENAGSSS